MSPSLKKTLVIGDVCADLVVQIPEKSGNDRAHTPPDLHGGGTGANTAVGLARLGVPTAFVGTIGEDGYGRFLRNGLDIEGIDTAHLTATPDAFTNITLALIDQIGERTLYGWPRRGAAHTRLSTDHIDEAMIADAAWLHTTGMCLVEPPVRDATLHSMALAQAHDVPVSIDLNLRLGFEDGQLPSAFQDVILHAMSLANVVFGSAEDEFIHLAPQSQPIEATARALTGGKRTIIARFGADGVMAVQPQGGAIRVPAFSVDVVDTLGAGDAFNAGFIAATLDGLLLEDVLRWGNAAAALKIGRSGARSTPYRDEVERFLAEN